MPRVFICKLSRNQHLPYTDAEYLLIELHGLVNAFRYDPYVENLCRIKRTFALRQRVPESFFPSNGKGSLMNITTSLFEEMQPNQAVMSTR